EHQRGEEAAVLGYLGGQRARPVVEPEDPRLGVVQADRCARAERSAGAALKLAKDRVRRRESGERARALEERAELGLLPVAPELLRRGEPEEPRDRREQREHLGATGDESRRPRRDDAAGGDEDREP